MFFGPCFQVEAIVDGFTTNNNLLKLLSSYDCCSQNNYFSKNHKHKRTLREALKKITILLLTFVNNRGGSGACFVNKKTTVQMP